MSWSSRIYWWRAPLSRTGWGPLTSIGNANAASADFTLSQWRSEAKLVAVRIGQVKEPLAPFGIARCGVWSVAGRDHARIEAIDIGMVEDDTPPPRPISLSGLCDEIEKAGPSPKTCKRGFITTMNDLKSQHAIEGDGARHIVGGQRDGTDALDHRSTAPFLVSCIGLHDGDKSIMRLSVAARDMATRRHDGHSYFSHRFGMVLFPVRRVCRCQLE